MSAASASASTSVSTTPSVHKALFRVLPAPKPTVQLRQMAKPTPADSELIVRVAYAAIQPGDLLALLGVLKFGLQLDEDYAGVSAAGMVEQVGKQVDATKYLGKAVIIYRGLNTQARNVGMWSEYARIVPSQCAIVPQNALDIAAKDLSAMSPTVSLAAARSPLAALQLFSGTLVNTFTAFAFLKEHVLPSSSNASSAPIGASDKANGVLITAGASATGRALLAFCSGYGIPAVSIVRSAAAADSLRALHASTAAVEEKHYWIVQSDSSKFSEELSAALQKANATVVFDGIGGALTSSIVPLLPLGSRVFLYGAVDRGNNLNFPTLTFLSRRITLSAFVNALTVQATDLTKLQAAMDEISATVAKLPAHFYTAVGGVYTPERAEEALKAASTGHATKRAVLDFTETK